MVDIITEHLFLTAMIVTLVTSFILILKLYRKKRCYERIIVSLIGSDKKVFELYKEAAKLDEQDVKAHIMGSEEKGRLSEVVKQVKALGTASARKQDKELRMMYQRLESIIKLANINQSQILDDLSKKK